MQYFAERQQFLGQFYRPLYENVRVPARKESSLDKSLARTTGIPLTPYSHGQQLRDFPQDLPCLTNDRNAFFHANSRATITPLYLKYGGSTKQFSDHQFLFKVRKMPTASNDPAVVPKMPKVQRKKYRKLKKSQSLSIFPSIRKSSKILHLSGFIITRLVISIFLFTTNAA